jgi:hypothetical protein
MRHHRYVLALCSVALLCACTTTRSSMSSSRNSQGSARSNSVAEAIATNEWLEPSPALREQIIDSAKKLPWTHGLERVELIHWFAQVGEPAYPTLLEMVLDARKDVAGSALAALGATRDSRLVDALHALPWPATQDADLSLERARTLLRLGDWGMVPELIEGLKDERIMTRGLCIQALFEATHERYGYDARAEEPERTEAIKKWELWWHDRQQDPLLGKKLGRAADAN